MPRLSIPLAAFSPSLPAGQPPDTSSPPSPVLAAAVRRGGTGEKGGRGADGRPGCRPPPHPPGWPRDGKVVSSGLGEGGDVRSEPRGGRECGDFRTRYPPPPLPSCRGRHGGELGQGRAAAGGVFAAGGLNGSASLSRGFYLCGRGREKPGGAGVLQGAIHSRAVRETWSPQGCSARGSPAAFSPPCLAALARRVLVFWGSGGLAEARCSVLVRWRVCGRGGGMGKLQGTSAPSTPGRCSARVSHLPQTRGITAI